MNDNLPFHLFTAIIAPLIIPFFEQTLHRSEIDKKKLSFNRLEGKKVKPCDESQTPDNDRIECAKTIDDSIIPFFRGLPGAYIGNIIWGITYKINGFDWWFLIYFILLLGCLGIVNIIKIQFVRHKTPIYIGLVFGEAMLIILSLFRLDILNISNVIHKLLTLFST